AAAPGLFLSARFWQPAARLLLQPPAGWHPAPAMEPAARGALPPRSAATNARGFAASRLLAARFAGLAPAAAPTLPPTGPEWRRRRCAPDLSAVPPRRTTANPIDYRRARPAAAKMAAATSARCRLHRR